MLSLIALCAVLVSGNDREIPFTYKHYKTFTYYFDSESEMKNFFDFRKHEVVADIGAGTGTKEGIFSLWTDSITFYLEDIDPNVMDPKKGKQLLKKSARTRGRKSTNTFKYCLGTEKTTNLPDAAIDKIIMIAAFHEFTHKAEMLQDIRKKLKPGGKVYLLESHCFTESHVNVSEEEAIKIFEQNGFKLLKKENPKYEKTYRMIFGF